MEIWGDKISDDGIIVFEGGSVQRDNIMWMQTFEFPKITEALQEIGSGWEFQVFTPFPSITLIRKRT